MHYFEKYIFYQKDHWEGKKGCNKIREEYIFPKSASEEDATS